LVVAAAVPSPWFFVVSVTEIVAPALALAGAERVITTRSGITFTTTALVLFASLISATSLAESATATM
jgi:hypothetical protein